MNQLALPAEFGSSEIPPEFDLARRHDPVRGKDTDRVKSAFSVSAWELTETYSPAAIDIAPANSAATPAIRTLERLASEAATPTIRLAVETVPSLAPRTAARSQPMREAALRFGVSAQAAHDCSGAEP